MRTMKLFTIFICILILFFAMTGFNNLMEGKEERVAETPYIKYIITTYSGGKEIEKFEVYSNMQGSYSKNSVTVYDSPSEDILLFYSTLDYKLEEIHN